MITPPSVTQTHSRSTKGQILNFGEEKRETHTQRDTHTHTDRERERFSAFQILNTISSFMKSLTEIVTTPNPQNEHNENFINPWLPGVIVNQLSQINCYNGAFFVPLARISSQSTGLTGGGFDVCSPVFCTPTPTDHK